MRSKQLLAWVIVATLSMMAFATLKNSTVVAEQNNTWLMDLADNSSNYSMHNITEDNDTLQDVNFTQQPDNTTAETVLTNTSLDVLMPASIMANSSFLIQAQYTSGDDPVLGIDVCILGMGDLTYYMDLNMTNARYYHEMDVDGNTTLQILCNASGYHAAQMTIALSLDAEDPAQSTDNTTEVIDHDQDGYPEEIDCNDLNPQVFPNATEILDNGIDDDCDPESFDVLALDLTTNKQLYAAQEPIHITLDATKESETYLTVDTPTNISYVYILSNGTYPITHSYDLTAKAGLYTVEAVNYYKDRQISTKINFTVESGFDIEITKSDDRVDEGENIDFGINTAGAIGETNVIWNMDDGTKVYEDEFMYSYNQSGTYNVVLLATDQGQNQAIKTQKIIVDEVHKLKVIVKDNATGTLLEDAQVELDGEQKQTNSSGITVFDVRNRTYDLEVSMPGYYSYEGEYRFNNSFMLTVRLNENEEDEPPIVSLVSPANNSRQYPAKFTYRFDDSSQASCTLYTSEDASWWVEINTSIADPNKNTDILPKINNGTYYWQVECIDEDDNVGISQVYYVNLSRASAQKAKAAASTTPSTYDVVQEVYNLIPDFETYTPDEKKMVDYLDLDVVIKDASRMLEMANRDLYNLRSESDVAEYERKQKEILKRIDDIRANTPQSISVIDKADFVKYATDKDVEDNFVDYLQFRDAALTKQERKQLLEHNQMMQKKVTVQTIAYSVEIDYISGDTQSRVVVVHSIEYNGEEKDAEIVLFFPKPTSASFSPRPKEVLEDDRVFAFDISKTNQLVYMIEEDIDLNAVPANKLLILTTDMPESTGSPTGFAVFDTLGFSDRNVKVFFIQLAIVGMLLGIYLYYRFTGSSDEIGYDTRVHQQPMQEELFAHQPMQQGLPAQDTPYQYSDQLSASFVETTGDISSKDQAKIAYMQTLLVHVRQYVAQKEWKQAAYGYHEIKFLYDLLDREQQSMFDHELHEIMSSMTVHHIRELYKEAIIKLSHGEYEAAHIVYEEMEQEFGKLDADDQHEVYSKCCEIVLHLKNHEINN